LSHVTFTHPITTPFEKPPDEIETRTWYAHDRKAETDIKLRERQRRRRAKNHPRIIAQIFFCHSLNVVGSYLGYQGFVVGEFPVRL
jgi:hypothetical protein